MTADLVLAFAGYALVTSITPGPNNAMLLASGANFGFQRTLPHLAGINLGFGAMVLAVGLGAGAVFAAYPGASLLLKALGAAYLVYLAWRIATAAPPEGEADLRRPLGFLGAAAFQWINGKAWVIVIGALSTYIPVGGSWRAVLPLTAVYLLVNAPCIALWAAGGVAIRRLLRQPARLRLFNRAMAVLLLLSLLPIAVELIDALRTAG